MQNEKGSELNNPESESSAHPVHQRWKRTSEWRRSDRLVDESTATWRPWRPWRPGRPRRPRFRWLWSPWPWYPESPWPKRPRPPRPVEAGARLALGALAVAVPARGAPWELAAEASSISGSSSSAWPSKSQHTVVYIHHFTHKRFARFQARPQNGVSALQYPTSELHEITKYIFHCHSTPRCKILAQYGRTVSSLSYSGISCDSSPNFPAWQGRRQISP